jgi:hypothetical protein
MPKFNPFFLSGKSQHNPNVAAQQFDAGGTARLFSAKAQVQS